MEPSYPVGPLVIVKPTNTKDILIGDVITYQPEAGKAEYITHRVVSIARATDGTETFVTKGDNNASPDDKPIVEGQVMGAVWYSLPWIGYVNNALGGEGKSWWVIGLAVLLFGYAGWQFIGALVTRSPKQGRNTTAPTASADAPLETRSEDQS